MKGNVLMSSSGYHWYNNGEIEINSKECPQGFILGRLPISDETRKKMSDHCFTRGISPEDDAIRRAKISQTKQSKSEEEKQQYALSISNARKGKGVGKAPWNKGKVGVQVAWNKGKKVNFSPESIKQMLDHQYQTKKANNSFNISKQEDECFAKLQEIYGEDNVIRSYRDLRYPFCCDFYIPSEDLFIEFNRTWTHGGHPFDPTSLDDISTLEKWQEKAKTSNYYKNAIYTWTDLDVRKQETAKRNNLNYQTIY